ncbi:hypothetical protein BSM4216_1120 [Bacillus smithii]|nr:hypothetical protein BSM4216_1120 [Bacillus smithii]
MNDLLLLYTVSIPSCTEFHHAFLSPTEAHPLLDFLFLIIMNILLIFDIVVMNPFFHLNRIQ